MKYIPSQEGWLANLFGFGKKNKDSSQDEVYSDAGYFSPSDASEILGAVKHATDEQWTQFIESTSVTMIDKSTYEKCVVNGIMKLSYDLMTKLIPAWEKMEKFKWHTEEDNPVDYDTGTIKVPGLRVAMNQAGSVAEAILRSPEYQNSVLYSDPYTIASRSNETLKDHGYTKNDIINFIKYVCLVNNESKEEDTRSYCVAEDHTDGWNYVVSHVFHDYYDDTKMWPDLEKGENVFLASQQAYYEFNIDAGRLVTKFVKFFDLNIDV